MRTFAKRLLLPFLIVLFLAIIAVLASRYASLDWFVRNDRWLRSVIRANPVASSFIAFAVYLVVSLVPGTTGKSIVLGWLFGLLAGVIIVNTALVAASLVTFLLCRYYLKAEVQSRFGFYLRPIQRQMKSDGTLYLLTLRLAHAPFSFMNYAAGAGTDVSFYTFWWTTQLGLLPGNLVFVYAGSRLPTIEEAIVRGPLGLLDGPMIAALASTIFLPWLVRKVLQLILSRRKEARQLPCHVSEVHRRNET
ncbi:MAG: TVP38/TMEM64 family protein [Fuerstiella sp.]|nr:TVP38/TMEM64 family protein [Fuerstiella sp.]MCP4857442.1 TVP38/TMEM64 family protein [Fuerstiella sp.]